MAQDYFCMYIGFLVRLMASKRAYQIYSAQRNRETGSGAIGRIIADKPGWEDIMKEDKAAQDAENKDYKRRIAAGEVVPRKYYKRGEVPKDPNVPVVDNQIGIPRDRIVPQMNQQQERKCAMTASFNASQITPAEVIQMREPFHLHLDGHTGNTIFAVGSSKRGKSTAIMKIYDDYFGGADRKFCSILWSANPQATPYRGHSKLIKAVWGNGKEGETLIKEQKKIQVGTNNEYKFLNIFDDVLHMRTSKLMDNLIMTYRNSKMSTIVSMQYSNMLQKCARANINHVLLFGMNTDEAIEVMVKTYLQGYLKKNQICKIPDAINWYKAVTADHGFIHCDQNRDLVTFHRLNL